MYVDAQKYGRRFIKSYSKKCLNQIRKSILTLKNILFFFVESYFLFVRMKKKPQIESTLRSLIVSNLFTKFKYENERDNGWNY
jgi:hypothetical protein